MQRTNHVGSIDRFVLFLCLALLGLSTWAQIDTEISKETMVYKDTLKLDFYSDHTSAGQNRPLIILMHGGGFSGGRRDGTDESGFCAEMARKGYAVASISYRLTRKGESFSCDCPTKTKISTFVKASEDLTDAVTFLMSRNELSFDRNRIVLAGSSAGAEAVLSTAFMTGHYEFKHLKPIDFAGVISFAGAMVNSAYINSGNAIPTLFFHGEKDKLVPFGTHPHHYCDSKTEGYLMLDGPETIVARLGDLGVSYILAFDPDGGHDWADMAYDKTELVHHFIEELILQERFEQSLIRITKEEEK